MNKKSQLTQGFFTRNSSACTKAPMVVYRFLSSARNPTLERNITSISKPVAKLWPFRISKMAVSRHLGFDRMRNSAIRSADPENPSLQPNTEWLDAPFVRYSPSNYTVTLKLGFGVTQGHRKRHYST